jgi:hypothetical protein
MPREITGLRRQSPLRGLEETAQLGERAAVCVLRKGSDALCEPDQMHGFERRLTTDIYPSAFK